MSDTMRKAKLKVYRGDKEKGEYKTYEVPVEAGMVVLDAIHYIQANYDPELAVRWNCKAAKCGSCSAEVNGMPSLMCKTRMDAFRHDEDIMVQPLKTLPSDQRSGHRCILELRSKQTNHSVFTSRRRRLDCLSRRHRPCTRVSQVY
jgi:hypothetical protein